MFAHCNSKNLKNLDQNFLDQNKKKDIMVQNLVNQAVYVTIQFILKERIGFFKKFVTNVVIAIK